MHYLTCVFSIFNSVHDLVFITRWENSGNGSEQRQEDDKDFGHVVENQAWLGAGAELFMDGDNRENFLREIKPHVLYFWQLNDENNMLSHSLARLSDDMKVDSNNVPTTCEPA